MQSMHAFKTAAAVRTVAEVACVIANAEPALRAACTRFSESWGSLSRRWRRTR